MKGIVMEKNVQCKFSVSECFVYYYILIGSQNNKKIWNQCVEFVDICILNPYAFISHVVSFIVTIVSRHVWTSIIYQ